jgi:hypothetical protein
MGGRKMNTELNTELNTPRTDAQAGWAIANQYGQSTGSELLGDPDGVFVHAVFARTLERELAESRNAERLARVQLGNEREKALALRLACERIVEQWDKNHDANPIGAGGRMYSWASEAMEKTERET